MDRTAFARMVATLSVGKHLPEAVYAHVEALALWPVELREAVDAARTCAKLDYAYQVVSILVRRSRELPWRYAAASASSRPSGVALRMARRRTRAQWRRDRTALS